MNAIAEKIHLIEQLSSDPTATTQLLDKVIECLIDNDRRKLAGFRDKLLAFPSLPRSSVGAVLGRSSVQKTTTTLERRNGIPTLERGNETETNVFTHDPVTDFDLTERVENRFHVSK